MLSSRVTRQAGKERSSCNIKVTVEDDISNVTFSGDESDTNNIDAGSARYKAPAFSFVARKQQQQQQPGQQSTAVAKIKKQQNPTPRQGVPQTQSTGEVKNKFSFSNEAKCHAIINQQTLAATIKRATAAAALANEAQRLAQLRAQAHLQEERNKPCYKGGTKLKRRKKIEHVKNNMATQKIKKQWDCSAQPLVGKGTLKMRNIRERDAITLVERRERQLALRRKTMEHEEILQLEAKRSLKVRQVKNNVEAKIPSAVKVTKPKRTEQVLRKELQMKDRSDGEIERTYTKIQITPSKSAEIICCYRTRSTSPFDEKIVADLMAIDSVDNGHDEISNQSSLSPAQHRDDDEMLQERQMQVLKRIEFQLKHIRLVNVDDEDQFQLEGLRDTYEKDSKLPNELGNNLQNDKLLVSEAVNETDAVSCITISSPENNNKILCAIDVCDFQTSDSNDENIFISTQLEYYMENKQIAECNVSGPEVLSSKMIELIVEDLLHNEVEAICRDLEKALHIHAQQLYSSNAAAEQLHL